MVKAKTPRKITASSGATRYVCPECGLSHAWEQQARACCLKVSVLPVGDTIDFHPTTLKPSGMGAVIYEDREAKADPVNSPAHYTDGGIETIDFIEAKLNPEQFTGYCLGNALKYISRSGKKDTGDVDLRKARWYINRALGEVNPS